MGPHVRGFLAVLGVRRLDGFDLADRLEQQRRPSGHPAVPRWPLWLAGNHGFDLWIYGIGWVDAPIWEEAEIVEGTDDRHLTFAALDEANELCTETLPSAYEE